MVFWHPKGSKVRKLIEDFWKDAHEEGGYDIVYTPHIANLNLWKTSGHFDFYRSDMFDQMDVENEQYQIKPMNCPFHCLMYKDELRSYRDLPIRWAELGTVYRLVYTYVFRLVRFFQTHALTLTRFCSLDTNDLGHSMVSFVSEDSLRTMPTYIVCLTNWKTKLLPF